MEHTLVKGFVVGHGPRSVRADGSTWHRPRLLEVELAAREVAMAINDGIVWLDAEAVERTRDLLSEALEAMI